MTTPACSDCGIEMERGFIPDLSDDGPRQTGWHRGDPEPNRIFGIKTSTVKVDLTRFVAITAYRCSDCGMLKFYAKVPEDK